MLTALPRQVYDKRSASIATFATVLAFRVTLRAMRSPRNACRHIEMKASANAKRAPPHHWISATAMGGAATSRACTREIADESPPPSCEGKRTDLSLQISRSNERFLNKLALVQCAQRTG